MNTFLHRSEDRGHVQAGWLDTKHSFSFGSWYDPKYMGVYCNSWLVENSI